MKQMFIVFIVIFFTQENFAQKPIIDTSVFGNWPSVSNPAISNDGNYFLYSIVNQPLKSQTLVFRSIEDSWKMDFIGSQNASFTDDSRKAIFKKKDSLFLITLGSSSIEYISNVRSFHLFTQGTNEWLAYSLNNAEKELVLRNVKTDVQYSIKGVEEYWLSKNGNIIVFTKKSKKEDKVIQELYWAEVSDGKPALIWEGDNAGNIVLNTGGTQLAFSVSNKVDDQIEKAFWYYKIGTERPVLLATNYTQGIDIGLELEEITSFSEKENRLFIKLKEKDTITQRITSTKVDVWGYKDLKLQSEQLLDMNKSKACQAVVMLDKNRVIRLENENEYINERLNVTGNFVIVNYFPGHVEESQWISEAKVSVYLVDLRSGERKLLKKNIKYTNDRFAISPSENYVLNYDCEKRLYSSYNIKTGVTISLTHSVPVSFGNSDYSDQPYPPPPVGIAAWVENDETVLIYDDYDLWQLDLDGKKLPINITNGFGRKRKIKFRLVDGTGRWDYIASVKCAQKVLLSAFSKVDKFNGFSFSTVGSRNSPEELSLGPYNFCHFQSQSPPYNQIPEPFKPIKAKNSNVWIVRRMSATESPNFFFTKEFKFYHPLTNVYPERKFNWIVAQLINWKTPEGSKLSGVLYRPENLDTLKKHPVIVNFYEKLSDGINKYIEPKATGHNIDIPYFVSNGYVVFIPDVNYEIGEVGNSIYNSVITGCRKLFRIPWIDSTKIGIQGHSFGGYGVNYLISSTKMFAAAAENAGTANLLSNYGELRGYGLSNQFYYEIAQGRLGSSPWEKMSLYFKNSPIYKADKVQTPLLITHNKNDGAVSWSQGVEWFNALRRLGKKVWMLQYDYGTHTVYQTGDMKDLTIRMTQFFNHYLKSAPAPIWMTQGIPARLKSTTTGYPLDPAGNCGKDCKVCKMWNDKMAKDSIGTMQEIERCKKEEHWE